MHDTWYMLRWVWAAVVIVWCVLGIIAAWRLRGPAKKVNQNILIVMGVLIVIRTLVGRVFGGLAYRFAVMIVGIAAGVAALIVAKMLITQKPADTDGAADELGKGPIQSLKLS